VIWTKKGDKSNLQMIALIFSGLEPVLSIFWVITASKYGYWATPLGKILGMQKSGALRPMGVSGKLLDSLHQALGVFLLCFESFYFYALVSSRYFVV